MKKFYLLLTLLLVAFVGRAETVVDELTATGLGLKTSYGLVSGKTFTSGTVYSAVAMTNGNYIQIKSDNITADGNTHYTGVFNTTSVGNARKVEVTWASNTTKGRVLNVYGKATPFVSTSAYDEQGGTLIGSITYGTTTTLDITKDFPYLAFASNKSAQYIESLKITWETGGVTTICATPTFSEEEGTFYGDAGETKVVTLSCATDGATIKYTVNGGAEQTYNGTNIPGLVFPGTYEVTAWATKDGLDNSATVTKNYKLVDVATLDLYTKVTDASALKAGDKVIIVCETKKVAMSTTQNDNNRGKTDYTTIEDAIPETGDIQVVTLEDAGTTGSVKRFAFNTGDGYLYSASSSSNYLKTRKANNDDNGIWTISIDKSGNATIKSQGSNTRNTIKYNSSSTIFSSYSSGQTAVQLYYSPAQAATTCATPTFSVAGGTFYGNAGETLDVALSCATEGATIKYTVNGKEQTNNGTNILNLVYPGTYEVAAWATADGHETSATATATYKLVDKATLTKFTKVTDASVLKAGDKVIIVCETKKVAMSTTQNDNNRGKTDYTTIEDAIPETGDIQVVTLEDAGTTGSVKRFAFNTGDGYLYSASSSSNYLKTREANNDDNGIWTISIDESGNATIKSQGSNTRNTIKYNSSSTIFSSYSSGQSAVQLYYSPAPAATACADPTFSVEEGTHYGFDADTKQVTLSCSTEGATIMYSINGGDEQTYKSPITITCPSETTISAYATITMADGSLGKSETVSKTYNYEVYPSVASIAEFKTQADATKPYMFTCPLTVTYQKGNRLYLRDEAGDAILVYGNIDQTYSAGNQLPANKVVGTYKVYNQMAEIIPVEGVEWPTTETIVDASPVEMTIEQLNTVSAEQWSTIASKLVVIKGAKVSADGSTITVGEESFTPAIPYRFEPELTNANCIYDIVGIIETHKNAGAIDGIQFCQTAYLDNYSPEKMYMIGYIQSHNQDWNATQGVEMAKEAAGRYSANVNLSFNDWFAITSRIAENNDNGGWAYINADRYAYTSGVFGKVATDYVMTQGDVKTQVFWAGNFKVTVDYYAKTISFVPAAVNADGTPDYSTVFPEKLRIVGEIADGEWAAESIVENHLATRGEDGYTYTFNELQFVKTGKFRLTTAWDSESWNGSYSVNGRALKAATDAEPRINFGTVANILPFTTNDLVADVQKYSENLDLVYANLQLIVNLKDMTVTGTMSSGVSQIKVGSATVTATNGTIRVDGGNTTSIYNIAGQAIALGSKAKEFSVARGMYIVNVDGKATKVVVR